VFEKGACVLLILLVWRPEWMISWN